ncbi:MAG: YbgA family protein [Dissulfurispiraceae bacterium]
MDKKIKLGISSCLLGEKVRYDGSHKLDHYLKNTLNAFVQWVPVCPEVEIGLTVPREPMRLVGTPESPRLVTNRTRVDYTDVMARWAKKRLQALEKEELCGFVFKCRSPSSGMKGVKVYNPSGIPSTRGVGVFAKAVMDKFPLLPVQDEGRLQNPQWRENFVERIFVYKRWKEFEQTGGSVSDLVRFHTNHKLLILSHSPKHYAALGNLVANAKQHEPEDLPAHYLKSLMEGLCLPATCKKNTNVLIHVAGYFKKLLSGDEKKELTEIIQNYHQELIPLIVPIVLIRHYVRKYDQPYLKSQYYLHPHPIELMLRNHV